jgi:hypothetical protein
VTRRVVEYQAKSRDHEQLAVVIIEREGIKKEQLKKENRACKRHSVLVSEGHLYEFNKN